MLALLTIVAVVITPRAATLAKVGLGKVNSWPSPECQDTGHIAISICVSRIERRAKFPRKTTGTRYRIRKNKKLAHLQQAKTNWLAQTELLTQSGFILQAP